MLNFRGGRRVQKYLQHPVADTQGQVEPIGLQFAVAQCSRIALHGLSPAGGQEVRGAHWVYFVPKSVHVIWRNRGWEAKPDWKLGHSITGAERPRGIMGGNDSPGQSSDYPAPPPAGPATGLSLAPWTLWHLQLEGMTYFSRLLFHSTTYLVDPSCMYRLCTHT